MPPVDCLTETGPSAAPPEGALEMLSRLQARTLQQCATLKRLAEYLAECGSDDEARQVAGTVARYFDTCQPRLFADEEEDLFPALLESMAGSDPVCLNELTAAMAGQHRMLEAGWARLRNALAAVMREDSDTLDRPEVEVFVNLYQSHIEREQSELLPMVQRLLTDDALAELWAAMRRRHEH
jgi:hemerythrin-like domain-containing protein